MSAQEAHEIGLDAAIAARLGYLRLGNEVVATDHATFVRNADTPWITDANHGAAVRAAPGTHGEAVAAAVLAAAEEVLGGVGHRAFRVDPRTPPAFEARLALEGYRSNADLEMLLTGELATGAGPGSQGGPPGLEIRTVRTRRDWSSLRRLKRADDEDAGARAGRPPRPRALSAQFFESKRRKAPAVRYFLARLDDEDCAFFSSWPGPSPRSAEQPVGVVEDLFTLPSHRRRGIATALIHHAVADARARGAGPVLIGADPADTPRHLYAALGFRPLFLLRGYWREAP